MSTAADIITEVDELIDDVNALLATNTVESVIQLLDRLAGGDVVHTLITEFAGLLTSVRTQLDKLLETIEQPLRHARALSGLLGLLQPLMTGLQRLVDTSADNLEDAGLDAILQITDPIRDAVGYGSDVLEVGAGVLDMLPPPDKLQELQQSFDDLIATVESYAEATA